MRGAFERFAFLNVIKHAATRRVGDLAVSYDHRRVRRRRRAIATVDERVVFVESAQPRPPAVVITGEASSREDAQVARRLVPCARWEETESGGHLALAEMQHRSILHFNHSA